MLKVAFLPESFGDSSKLVTLPHPRNSKSNDFIINDGKIYEIHLVDRPHSSFFIGNSVNSDGSALFASRVHPLFMALPEMYQNRKQFQMKKDFFFNSKLKPIEDLIFPYFDEVCSSIPFDDKQNCYALDETKMINWLVGRVQKILPTLREKNPIEDKFLVEIGWGVVRHYLPNDISEMLKKALSEKYPGSFPQKTINETLGQPVEPEKPFDDVKKKTKPSKKKNAERPKGVKDIRSFWH